MTAAFPAELSASDFPANPTMGIVGLGYVGLPLAVAFGRQLPTLGFDIDPARVAELERGDDKTLETTAAELTAAKQLRFTTDAAQLAQCDVFIVTVPTPVDANKQPDLTPLRKASETLGRVLRPGHIVIYESTVYPGATEEDCVPVLEQMSGLVFNRDFFVGYSPERINPGDKERRLETILKITAGSTPAVGEYVDGLYRRVITAGTFPASSIKVAEAAKVIENTQRDLNIALINELALIFDKLEIDTTEVLAAAGTKWNFLPFRPGLVGGHCIGVDPYYLTHKAEEQNYHPDIILAGRRINDGMGAFVADKTVKLMVQAGVDVSRSRVLVLGATFKEDCPDLRNTRVVDILRQLRTWGCAVTLHDPWANLDALAAREGVTATATLPSEAFDGVIVAVAHQQFKALNQAQLHALRADPGIIYDVKSLYPRDWVDGRL